MILNLFISKKQYTASLAKKRLKTLIKKKKKFFYQSSYLPQLKNDLLLVIAKYIKIQPNKMSIQIEKRKKNLLILEINITNVK
ncbi:cell division topological specificity factor MinE [Buchnera aphidicola]|uniref:Cell division topological specificity factor n=1 Tax=Buchnera aphidicola subsp. Cinara cedri (strain Cc) TaxID=372461 RepID=MINE_BUCCC|nr:cell division topological specificity factor MinE [Buchnera aphidicola]Q057M4.1 RecName: Full=Cell division topological specificity factor [Buchnera aphidicola BCc]ABJ90675.1 cell division topological specificity factor [Buchnera aphidicola BCc]